MLVELGRWGEAEAVLLAAKLDFEAGDAHAELASRHRPRRPARPARGAIPTPSSCSSGKDQLPEALLPAARLHLARGDHDLARAAARRGLRSMGDDRLRATELLFVVIEAELAAGDRDAAAAACDAIVARCGSLDVPTLRARAAAVRARALAANGDAAGAIALLESAVADVDPVRLAWIHANLLVELARLRDLAGDAAGASLDAAAAVAALERLDVVVALETIAAARPADRPSRWRHRRRGPASLARDGKWWNAAHGGAACSHAGLEGPGVSRRPDHQRRAPSATRSTSSTASRASIPTARRPPHPRRRRRAARQPGPHGLPAPYRGAAVGGRRRARGRDARARRGDRRTSSTSSWRQLAAAFGLGGRDRRAASAAERARLNVTRAVRAAIAKLAEALPEAGAALDRRVRTGLYCAYEPVDGDLRWIVQS